MSCSHAPSGDPCICQFIEQTRLLNHVRTLKKSGSQFKQHADSKCEREPLILCRVTAFEHLAELLLLADLSR